MMNTMRKNMKVILWIVVIAFVGTIFFVWGMDLGRRKDFMAQSSAAVVNDQAISYEDFGKIWDQESRQLYSRSAGEPNPNDVAKMRRRVMSELIDRVLLQQEFAKLKMKVYPEEVAARIAAVPAFSDNGKFSAQKYLQLLEYNRINPQEFEAEQKNTLEVLKADRFLRNTSLVTEAQVRQFFQSRSRKLQIVLAGFRWQDRAKSMAVSPDAIQDYFAKHQSEFAQPAEVRASHILLTVDAKATEEQKLTVKLKVENLRAELQKGADFADLARKYSQDPGSAKQGGDLGFFHAGQMVPTFEKAAFAMKVGEISQPVESPFGFHLIKVTGKHDEKKPNLSEVRSKITERLQEEKARQATLAQSLQFLAALADAKNIEAAAKKTGVPVQRTGWITLESKLPGVEKSADLLDRVFDLPLNRPSSALPVGDALYYAQVLEEQWQPVDEKRWAQDRDSLLGKAQERRAENVLETYLTALRRSSKIVNNIEKEAKENESGKKD
jgi:peptidyl-prolyl cis-trans isomerase D